MSLSEKEKEQLNRRLDKIKDIGTFLREREKTRDIEYPEDFEVDVGNMSIVMTYLSTENLVEHSETLSRWTKIIAFTSIALIIFAIAQIILVIVLS